MPSPPLVAFSQGLLHTPGPFYCYPWKCLINEIYGTSNYRPGYLHFWKQHQNPHNLAWHMICLVLQILGNFCLLIAMDGVVFGADGTQWISILSALTWVLYLTLTTEAPQLVRLGSLFSITLGYYIAQTVCLRTVELCIYASFGVIWLTFVYHKGTIDIPLGAVQIFLLLVLKNFVGFVALEVYRGYLSEEVTVVASVYFGILFLISLRSDRTFGNQFVSVIYGTLVGQVVATLTNSSALYVHSCAFTATLLQGLAHGLSREQGTMQRIQEYSDHASRVAYEYAHVVYFPNLLLHAVYDVWWGVERTDKAWKPS